MHRDGRIYTVMIPLDRTTHQPLCCNAAAGGELDLKSGVWWSATKKKKKSSRPEKIVFRVKMFSSIC